MWTWEERVLGAVDDLASRAFRHPVALALLVLVFSAGMLLLVERLR